MTLKCPNTHKPQPSVEPSRFYEWVQFLKKMSPEVDRDYGCMEYYLLVKLFDSGTSLENAKDILNMAISYD